jgi:hypothetical protein
MHNAQAFGEGEFSPEALVSSGALATQTRQERMLELVFLILVPVSIQSVVGLGSVLVYRYRVLRWIISGTV